MKLHEQFIKQKKLSSKSMNDETICNAGALHLSFTGILAESKKKQLYLWISLY